MNYSILALFCLLAFGNGAKLLAAKPEKKPTGAKAKADAGKWLEGLGEKGLVISEKRSKKGFTMAYGPSAIGRITTFQFQQPDWMVSFRFRGEITEDTSLKELRKRFWSVSLDRLPTPELKLPGWDVRPRTPVSSFADGVEFLDYADGKLKVRVKTKFFALYGRDPSVRVPADAASPPGSYFQIRKKFPLDLTLEAPVALAKKK